jgi:hypothetical protein
MPMTGILSVQGSGNPLPIWRTEDKQEVLIGSVEEVIQRNRKVNSGRIPKKKTLSNSKLEIWTKKTMI